MARVRIINAPAGTRQHTTLPRAMEYVRSGRAVFTGEQLRFLEAPDAFVDRLRSAEAEVEFARNRGARVYWNGADPNLDATHLPGTASVFPKQGRRLSR